MIWESSGKCGGDDHGQEQILHPANIFDCTSRNERFGEPGCALYGAATTDERRKVPGNARKGPCWMGERGGSICLQVNFHLLSLFSLSLDPKGDRRSSVQ